MTKKQEAAEKQDAQLPAEMELDALMEEDEGAGTEGADADSFAIPFLRILQKGSPQCDEAESSYLEGAKAGRFFNTVTQEMYDEITFLACAFERKFIRWAPRSGDGTFKGEYTVEQAATMKQTGEVKQDEGKWFFPHNSDDVHYDDRRHDTLQDVRNHFGIALHEGGATQVLLSLTSTQIKKSKQIMALCANAKITNKAGKKMTPPTWLCRLKLSTIGESNAEGNWSGLRVLGDGFLEEADIYLACRDFHDLIIAGQAKVNYDESKDSGGEARTDLF